MDFNNDQLDKLSDLFIDIAKGSFLASLAFSAFSPQITFFITLRGSITGMFFTYLSLKMIERKVVK